MFVATVLKQTAAISISGSTLMGNIYLGFLAAYVGRKELMRWFTREDAEQMPRYLWKKLTRGEIILGTWAVLTAVTVLLWQMKLIPSVPQVLLYTMAEVGAIWLGSESSKYFKQSKDTGKAVSDYGTRVVELARKQGPIDNQDCQRELGMDPNRAYRLLVRMAKKGQLVITGTTKGRKYTFPNSTRNSIA